MRFSRCGMVTRSYLVNKAMLLYKQRWYSTNACRGVVRERLESIPSFLPLTPPRFFFGFRKIWGMIVPIDALAWSLSIGSGLVGSLDFHISLRVLYNSALGQTRSPTACAAHFHQCIAISVHPLIRTWVPSLIHIIQIACARLSTSDPYEPTHADIHQSDLWKIPWTCLTSTLVDRNRKKTQAKPFFSSENVLF